jgi:hypothetical protein
MMRSAIQPLLHPSCILNGSPDAQYMACHTVPYHLYWVHGSCGTFHHITIHSSLAPNKALGRFMNVGEIQQYAMSWFVWCWELHVLHCTISPLSLRKPDPDSIILIRMLPLSLPSTATRSATSCNFIIHSRHTALAKNRYQRPSQIVLYRDAQANEHLPS